MFPTSPSIVASSFALMVGLLLTLGLAIIWLIFAATLITTMIVAIHRSIPRTEL